MLKDEEFPEIAEIIIAILEYVRTTDYNVFEADEWFSVSDYWDINMWYKDGIRWATIYGVDKGEADTSKGIGINMETLLIRKPGV